MMRDGGRVGAVDAVLGETTPAISGSSRGAKNEPAVVARIPVPWPRRALVQMTWAAGLPATS
jgi:hypothetical protein